MAQDRFPGAMTPDASASGNATNSSYDPPNSSYYAAASMNPVSSGERIVAAFMDQGRPDSPANVVEGEICGGFNIRTPKVGDGFIEWAISGYDLEGKIKNPPAGVNYDKHGDFTYDKIAITAPEGTNQVGALYDKQVPYSNANVVHDKVRKER